MSGDPHEGAEEWAAEVMSLLLHTPVTLEADEFEQATVDVESAMVRATEHPTGVRHLVIGLIRLADDLTSYIGAPLTDDGTDPDDVRAEGRATALRWWQEFLVFHNT